MIGLAESLYRHATSAFALAFYGLLFATLALPLLWLKPAHARWFNALLPAAAALILVRFMLVRDLFHEAPGSGPKATLLAAGAALATLVFFLLLNLGVRRLLAAVSQWHTQLAILPGLGFAVLFSTAALTSSTAPKIAAAPVKDLRGQAPQGVILVIADTLRADVLGAYGAPPHRDSAPSPHFDTLAEHGAVYLNMSAQASWTKPAVASIMTSLPPSGHVTMSKDAALPSSLPTLASVLHDNGVNTGAVVSNYNLAEDFGFARGFDSFRYLAPARYLGAPESANKLAGYNIYRVLREKFLKQFRSMEYFYQNGTAVNQAAQEFLSSVQPGQRFFLWLHYMDAHDPYFDINGHSFARVSDPEPPKDWAPAMSAAYKDGVKRFDTALGEFQQILEQKGLAASTLLIVSSDHGEEFADHGGFYHGTTLYEEMLHVPLLMHGAQIAPQKNTALARQIDLAPTVLSYFGIASPSSFAGQNLLSHPSITTSIAEEDHQGNQLRSIRHVTADNDQKLILANQGNPRGLAAQELYALSHDPLEKNPLDLTQQMSQEKLNFLLRELSHPQTLSHTETVQPVQHALDEASQNNLRSLGYVQ